MKEELPRSNHGIEQVSETEAVSRLSELGVENIEAAFRILEELDINKKPLDQAEIFWVKYGVPREIENAKEMLSVEGKLYFPKGNSNGEVVIFCPGFPGGNAGRFEQRYVRDFIDAGYAFATIRHNGTSLRNGDMSLEILNSKRRMDIAEQMGDGHIGGTRPQGYSPVDMINEPINAICALHEGFKRIHLMGQSMGVASNYNSVTRLIEHPEITDKIGNIVGISGYVGDQTETPDGIWNGMKQDFGKLAKYEFSYMQKVDLNAPLNSDWYEGEMKKVAEANGAMQVPKNIGNVLIFTPDDPLISGPDKTKEDYVFSYGPKSRRKVVIEDLSKPKEDTKPHSMLWIAPENLVRAVKVNVSEYGPHFIKVGGNNDGKFIKG